MSEKDKRLTQDEFKDMVGGAVEEAVKKAQAESKQVIDGLEAKIEGLEKGINKPKEDEENTMPFYEQYESAKKDDYAGIAINVLPKQYSDEWLREGTAEERYKGLLKGLRYQDEKLILSSHAFDPGPINKDGSVARPWDRRERMAIMHNVEKDLTSANSASMIPVEYMRVLINCLYFDPYNMMSKWRNSFTRLPDNRTPTLTSGAVVHWVSEGATKPESDPTFGEYQWEVKKQITRTDVTEEMLEDSDPSVAEEIRREHVRAMTLDSIFQFFYGDGVNGPRGIDLDIPAANTIFVGAIFNGDDFKRLKCAVRNDYRMDAWFYAHDCIWCIAERFKCGNGCYMWAAGFNDRLTEKTPETMIGYPYYRGVDDTMPIQFAQTGTGTGGFGHIFFGNPFNYMTKIRTQWRVKYNPDFNWEQNIDSFITESRWDGRMLCDSFSKLEGVRCTLTGV